MATRRSTRGKGTPNEEAVSQTSFEGLHNFRSLGGHVTASGERIKHGMVYRCAKTSGATAKDVDVLLNDLKVKTIIDLRHPSEEAYIHDNANLQLASAQLGPHFDMATGPRPVTRSEQHPRLIYYIPLMPQRVLSMVLWAMASLWQKAMYIILTIFCLKRRARAVMVPLFDGLRLPGLYRAMLEGNASRAALGEIFRLLIDESNYPLMYHCTHGKDRTGIVSMLLMGFLGVADDVIAVDYNLTERCVPEEHLLSGLPVDVDRNYWKGAPKEAIVETMTYLRTRYGSIEEYLHTRVGLTRDELAKLRSVLLAKS